ncbi:MAG: class I SAM-dependent methyltransferase [Gammaproteobacteria bacterium]|nr:MAG: class I SAM-dependent methyltransferase [Gammaproteobacteria bacterium]
MWDERYSTDEFVYGTTANEFLVSTIDRLPKGRVLCVAEGEGRNAVYLAQAGCEVVAVDASRVGLDKAARLARQRGVHIETVVADLADFAIQPHSWDAVVSIFCHLEPQLRKALHRRVVAGLRPGGVLVLEAYRPEQIRYATGGPAAADMMPSLAELRDELEELEFEHAVEIVRKVSEGKYHTGKGAVVQVLAVKR